MIIVYSSFHIHPIHFELSDPKNIVADRFPIRARTNLDTEWYQIRNT